MKELTLQDLEEMKPGIFARGEIIDSSEGINISDSGRILKWVASRGDIPDWCIYCHFATCDWETVKDMGDKVFSKNNIKKLVPCNDEAFKAYRY